MAFAAYVAICGTVVYFTTVYPWSASADAVIRNRSGFVGMTLRSRVILSGSHGFQNDDSGYFNQPGFVTRNMSNWSLSLRMTRSQAQVANTMGESKGPLTVVYRVDPPESNSSAIGELLEIRRAD